MLLTVRLREFVHQRLGKQIEYNFVYHGARSTAMNLIHDLLGIGNFNLNQETYLRGTQTWFPMRPQQQRQQLSHRGQSCRAAQEKCGPALRFAMCFD
jgi:hypothetical protein